MIRPFFTFHHLRLLMLAILFTGVLPLSAQRDDFRAPSLYAAPAPAKKSPSERTQRKEKETVRQEAARQSVASSPSAKPSPSVPATIPPQPKPQKRPAYSSMSDYELEVAASHGDDEAKTVLGARWVRSSDSIRHENGVKYLRDASSHGSQEARRILEGELRVKN